MKNKVLSVVLILVLSYYYTVAQTCLGFPHNGLIASINTSELGETGHGKPPLPLYHLDCTVPPPPQPGKQTLAFNFGQIYGYLTFPDECHPGDTITHDLIVAAEPEGIHLNFFRLNLSCNTTSGQETLYNETIENEDLPRNMGP